MRVVAIVGVLVGLFALGMASPMSENQYQWLFTKWIAQHNKQYEHDEFFYRYTVFKANFDRVHAHNQLNKTYTLAMNKFGDLTKAEFKSQYLGYKPINNKYLKSKNAPHVHNLHKVRDTLSVDWRSGQKVDGGSAVTPVKNQQQCGSCWSFSATGSLEGALSLKNGKLVSFSEQELVDCSAEEGNQGCNGGLMDQAFQYIIDYGLCTEASYAYTAADGTCQNTTCTKGVKAGVIKGFHDVPANDEESLAAAALIGPVSIAIEADQDVFQYYSSGVLDDASCGVNLDHGVLIVGYDFSGASGTEKYWIVKNSWGPDWGLSGYINLAYGKNTCGLSLDPSYPTFTA